MKELLERMRYSARVINAMRSGTPRKCTLCGYSGKFFASGFQPRFDAQCPQCGSLERHRLLMLWLNLNREILRGASLLHFAPEACLEKTLRPLVRYYKSADISGNADLKLNIESLDVPDASYDFIICCHVLEHVNDRLALSELYRILAPGGTAAIMVPVVQGWKETYEDPAIATPEQRHLHFGQSDHLRYFGTDICDRIRAAGFDLETFTANGSDSVAYSLIRGDTIYVCRRPAAP